MTSKLDEKILITRADDFGYTHSGNIGTIECLRAGFVKSAAILTIAPWFEEAAKFARENPQFCYGVHMGIIGEWRGYRWRPVLPYSEIRTLVDEDGFLWPSPAEFWAHKPSLDEMEKEFTAQIKLARKKGVNVDYIDTHYMMPYDEKIRPMVERIGKREGIPVSCLLGEKDLPDFGIYSAPIPEKEALLIHILEDMKQGVHLLIAHPGYPSVENDALVHHEPKDVQTVGVGNNRAAETAAYRSPKVLEAAKTFGIKLLSYREYCLSNSSGTAASH